MYLATDLIAKPYGLALVGFIMIGVGLFVAMNGTMGIIGGCKEKMPIIRTNMYMSVMQILLALIIAGFLMGGIKKVDR